MVFTLLIDAQRPVLPSETDKLPADGLFLDRGAQLQTVSEPIVLTLVGSLPSSVADPDSVIAQIETDLTADYQSKGWTGITIERV